MLPKLILIRLHNRAIMFRGFRKFGVVLQLVVDVEVLVVFIKWHAEERTRLEVEVVVQGREVD
jgi:hypothetical protein